MILKLLVFIKAKNNMANKNNIFEDIARISTAVASVAFESAKNLRGAAKSRMQGVARSADMVTYDEFDVIRNIALRSKEVSDSISKEFADLKKQMQHITSMLDVMKQQVGKPQSGADSKLLKDIRQIEISLKEKISVFEERLELLSMSAEPLPQTKPKKAAAEKAVKDGNINLFGDEQ